MDHATLDVQPIVAIRRIQSGLQAHCVICQGIKLRRHEQERRQLSQLGIAREQRDGERVVAIARILQIPGPELTHLGCRKKVFVGAIEVITRRVEMQTECAIEQQAARGRRLTGRRLMQHQGQGQVRACGIARNQDRAAGTLCLTIGNKISVSRDNIGQRRRVCVLRRQPIIDPDNRKPRGLREITHETFVRLQTAQRPATAMDEENQCRAVRRTGWYSTASSACAKLEMTNTRHRRLVDVPDSVDRFTILRAASSGGRLKSIPLLPQTPRPSDFGAHFRGHGLPNRRVHFNRRWSERVRGRC